MLSDAPLIEKRRAWREGRATRHVPEVRAIVECRLRVLDAMRDTLQRLDLSADAGHVESALCEAGGDPMHAAYVCQAIPHADHEGVYIDPFGWRVHSIITHSTARVRPYLRVAGQRLVELDVRNAQPLILAAALTNPALCATYIADAPHNGETPPGAEVLRVLRAVPGHEVGEFRGVCEAGRFYEAMAAAVNGSRLSRDSVKRAVFRDVLFGKVQQRGPVTAAFASLWPGIHDGVCQLKRACGYKIVARILQRMESTIMIDGVCGRIVAELPGVRFLTIHDAAVVVADRAEAVQRIIESEFQRVGVRVVVKRTALGRSEGTNDAGMDAGGE